MSGGLHGDTVGIVGAGRFGLALAHRIAGVDRPVVLWSQDDQVVAEIATDRRSSRLPEATLAGPLRVTGDPAELARTARTIVIAVSSDSVRQRARTLGDHLDGRHILVHTIGALASPGEVRVSQVLCEETPALRVGALAGPALPDDLVAGRFASMVVASEYDEVTSEIRRLLGVPPSLRIYRGGDLAGVELAAALAGAYTVAVGMADGLDLGPGPRAVLITRGLAEAARLGAAIGAEERTFSGLAGLGNLLVRSQSERSRDYQAGRALARGELPATPSEGVRAALAGVTLADRLGVRVPVLHGLVAVLSGKLDPRRAAAAVADSVALAE